MNDPVLSELRRVRHEISREVGTNLERLVERYAQLEFRFRKPAYTPQNRQTEESQEVGKSSP